MACTSSLPRRPTAVCRPHTVGVFSSFPLVGRPSVSYSLHLCRSHDVLCAGSTTLCSVNRSSSFPRHPISRTVRKRSWGLARCNATSGAEEVPPDSREEAINQAAASVSALLVKVIKRQGPSTVKQRREQRQVKLRVEIPVLDESHSSLTSLTLDLVSTLFKEKKGSTKLAVFWADGSVLDFAKEKSTNLETSTNLSFFDIQKETKIPEDVSVVIVVGARFKENASVSELVKYVNPRPVVVLNPEWSPEDEKSDDVWGSFVTSFEVAYAFIPLSIQGLFSKTEGAILKHVKSGAPGGKPWLIFVKDNDMYKCVTSLQHRPDSSDLESALYNSMGANSPVTKSIKFLRGLVTKG